MQRTNRHVQKKNHRRTMLNSEMRRKLNSGRQMKWLSELELEGRDEQQKTIKINKGQENSSSSGKYMMDGPFSGFPVSEKVVDMENCQGHNRDLRLDHLHDEGRYSKIRRS